VKILVCVKRVPMVGARIVLTSDAREVDTRQLGFTMSPHEECAVEEAVRIVEKFGGVVSVLTLGPSEAVEQLRDAASLGATHLVHLKTDGREWDPIATAQVIVDWVEEHEATGDTFDLILFGNEAPDTGDYQVGIRVAHALKRPIASGAKNLELSETRVLARRDFRGGDEFFALALPCVASVKEGINLPRYPSLPGRMRAKKAPIEESEPTWRPSQVTLEALRVPQATSGRAEILGTGVEAVPALLALLEKMGVLS
jgi:electron transfer flavoprotein beta subunit